MASPDKVRIREVGLREGFQILPKIVPTETKVKLLELLLDSGLREIEVTSFVRGDLVPQMADAEELGRIVDTSFAPRLPDLRFSALYLNPKGCERAFQFAAFRQEGWIPIATSETFLQRNNNLTFDQLMLLLPEWERVLALFGKRPHGLMVSTAFGCSYEGDTAKKNLISLLRKVTTSLSHPITEICLADTVGLGSPEVIRQAVRDVRSLLPGVEVSLHLHDTRGLGMANVYAGLCEGVKVFDSSFGGIGGCPFTKGAAGNIATEELVLLLDELGIESGVNSRKILETCRLFEQLVGESAQSRFYRSARESL